MPPAPGATAGLSRRLRLARWGTARKATRSPAGTPGEVGFERQMFGQFTNPNVAFRCPSVALLLTLMGGGSPKKYPQAPLGVSR
jgi:hypothetical protein